MSKKLKAQVMYATDYDKRLEWRTVAEDHVIRIVAPDGTQYELSYEHNTGIKLSAKKDVLIITPKASNLVAIRQNKMGNDMEGR